MNINRNNYEEFLLLYVDGELNSSEKKAVDSFLQINPDLKKELDILSSTKLTTENFTLTDKSNLYKSEANSISLKNYEEKFLLYADNELTVVEKDEVEKFVLQHPTLQQEFIAIKLSVLEKENIKHPNKESLYKKERKPIFYIGFKQITVAATLLLFIIALWMFNFNSNNINKNSVAKENIHLPKENKALTSTTTSTQKQLATTNNNVFEKEVVQQNTIQQKQQKNNVAYSIVNINSNTQKQNATTQTNHQYNVVETQVSNEKSINTIVHYKPEENSNIIAPSIVAANTQQPINTSSNSNIIQTKNIEPVYQYLDTDEDVKVNTTQSNSGVVYIGNMQVKKSKVKNILNKTKEFFSNGKSNTIDKAIAKVL